MEEQQKTKKECLAKKLAKKKDENLRQIAEDLLSNICTLAELRYKDSFFFFPFAKGNFFFKENITRMEYPKILQKKLKKQRAKEASEEEETVDGVVENDYLTEGDKITMNIVDKFNEVESTITDETSDCSREQAIVLKSISEALNLEGFKVNLSQQGLKISWWGEKD